MSELKETLKGIYGIMREMYGPFFPISKRKKENFLELVRQKTAYYKPKIEERCNIDLGHIKVKDNKEWMSDFHSHTYISKLAMNAAWKDGRIPTKKDYTYAYMGVSVFEMLAAVPLGIYHNVIGANFRYNKDTIYVPFYFRNRFMDIDFKERERKLDYAIVHELSHSVWDKVAEKDKGEFGEYRKWFEGFATYCADEYFADFYPKDTEMYNALPKTYTDGKKKIEKVVSAYGTDMILEIPKRWKEFSEEGNNKLETILNKYKEA